MVSGAVQLFWVQMWLTPNFNIFFCNLWKIRPTRNALWGCHHTTITGKAIANRTSQRWQSALWEKVSSLFTLLPTKTCTSSRAWCWPRGSLLQTSHLDSRWGNNKTCCKPFLVECLRQQLALCWSWCYKVYNEACSILNRNGVRISYLQHNMNSMLNNCKMIMKSSTARWRHWGPCLVITVSDTASATAVAVTLSSHYPMMAPPNGSTTQWWHHPMVAPPHGGNTPTVASPPRWHNPTMAQLTMELTEKCLPKKKWLLYCLCLSSTHGKTRGQWPFRLTGNVWATMAQVS